MSAEASLPALTRGEGPHAGQPLALAGPAPGDARLALVMLHGRGAGPEDMLGLHDHLGLPDVLAIAPAAAGRSWWPGSFLAPLAQNEPALSSALSVVAALLADLDRAGIGPERVVLAGFSQGACLTLEAAARLSPPLRAVAALSGALVGMGEAEGPVQAALYGHADKRFDYDGSLAGVPLLIGCHERDPHIPLARVRTSAEVLEGMGAEAKTLVIPGSGHSLVEEEIAWLRGQLKDG
ncbi:alpha/beta hydrolase [Pseudoroseicyclus aestuarii]|uniref:Phospholipase/carboxylesterase n=1 Tax=Pseudoroseicyclus aestuarii TaxID=1795041 RepID=A0A318TD11_9RHOB|nr:phospholipase [Pseudoroseicyclus aestuarii]PYE86208.1 phospholipase/carboxylesterase [Pseudoroseicyclus aestuarii]